MQNNKQDTTASNESVTNNSVNNKENKNVKNPTNPTGDSDSLKDNNKKSSSKASNDIANKKSNVSDSNSLKNAGGSDSNSVGSVTSAAKSVGDAGRQAMNSASEIGDLYNQNDGKDSITSTVEDVGTVAVGAKKGAAKIGKGVGRGIAGDIPGAVKDIADGVKEVVKIIPSLLRLLIPVFFLIITLITIFLSAPAMIWQALTEKYEDWAYTKAVAAVNLGIDHAAFNVVDGISSDIEEFLDISDFKVKCNQYYQDYAGDGYEKTYPDGTSLSISMVLSDDGLHENAHIRFTDNKNAVYNVIYENADVTKTETESEVSYSQVISAFNLYRQRKAETDGAYKVCHTFTENVQKTIKEAGANLLENKITKALFEKTIEDALGGDDTEAQKVFPLYDTEDSPKDLKTELASDEIWGMADTGALYYYMVQDKSISKSLYNYTLTNENGDVLKAANIRNDLSSTKNSNGEYEINIKVNTFSNNDKETSSGQKYSSNVMKAFKIKKQEDIEEVVGKAFISDALIENAEPYAVGKTDFLEYLTVSQSKILYEKIVGGPSVLEKIIDGGLYADVTEEQIRNIVASQADVWTQRTKIVSATDETFFFRTNDEFTEAFRGTSVGWVYDESTGTYIQDTGKTFDKLDAIKLLGEDGMFVTYMYSRSLYAGQLKDDEGNSLKPRTYLFPEVYKSNNYEKTVNQLFSSEDYYQYFQCYAKHGKYAKNTNNNSAYYQLSNFTYGPDSQAWTNAFDTSIKEKNNKNICIEKGDLIFFNYFNIPILNPNDPVGSWALISSIFSSEYNAFFKNKGYQIGIVTDVNYNDQTIKASIYNFDEDPIKTDFLESTFDSTIQRYVGSSGLKAINVSIDYKKGTITPEWDDLAISIIERINSLIPKTIDSDGNKVPMYELWTPNPMTFITGYGKPDYQAYVDEINKRLIPLREEIQKSLAETAYDLGGGTLSYPLDVKDRNVTNPYKPGHDGIDYGIPVGTPVYSSEDGVVVSSKAITSGGSPGNGTTTPEGIPYRSYGEYIQIRHSNGLVTYYAHLSKRLVETGDTVKRKQLIGYSGNTGNSTGPHLHYEVRKNNVVVDPNIYLTDTKKKRHPNGYTYEINTPITKSPVNGEQIIATFYDAGPCCNGEWAGTTTAGFKIKNVGKYYDQEQAFVACNWLPIGTEIVITFPKSSSLHDLSGKSLVYTVQDTGSAGRLNTNCIDVFVPNDHSKLDDLGKRNITIKINKLGNGKTGINN